LKKFPCINREKRLVKEGRRSSMFVKVLEKKSDDG